jgi:ribosomal protein L11 methyltransferase
MTPADHRERTAARASQWLWEILVPVDLGQRALAAVETAYDEDLSEAGHPCAYSLSRSGSDPACWLLQLWFDSSPDTRCSEEALSALFAAEGISRPAAVLTKVLPRDWVRLSQAGLPPVIAGPFFVHGAHHRPPGGVIALHIEAGQAFGTGHHASTFGCLTLIAELACRWRPRRVLDFGTGSGVLGIACAKRWHVPVAACDIDPVAVAVARDNARLNEVAPLFHVRCADRPQHVFAPPPPYDLLVANILATPLIELAGSLTNSLPKGGFIILSGLTDEQTAAVAAAYKIRGLRQFLRISRQGWTSLALRR